MAQKEDAETQTQQASQKNPRSAETVIERF
jgi:hypothetical protein